MTNDIAPLRVAFAGTPEFAAQILAQLIDSPFAPVAVLTQPDRPKGRGRALLASPVKQLAEREGYTILQPRTLRRRDHDDPSQIHPVERLRSLELDTLVVAAYGLILPSQLLQLPTFGCINVHASMLPRWRGAAPIERAIMAGDPATGVCIMDMEEGLDAGGVYASASVPIGPDDGAGAVESVLAQKGGRLLVDVLDAFAAAKAGVRPPPVAVPQDAALATYAHKIEAADRLIDWSDSATAIANRVRALADRQPVRVKLGQLGMQLLKAHAIDADRTAPPGTLVGADKQGIRVATGRGQLAITELRMESGKGTALDAAAALNGYRRAFESGSHFT